MERIISYEELPNLKGQSVYFRMETDPKLYLSLLSKGYNIINNISLADKSTIYITGRRQCYLARSTEEYLKTIENMIRQCFHTNGVTRPKTKNLIIEDLLSHKYKLPFVLKNVNQNGGREKFLIKTEEDYENLINAINFLLNKYLIKLAATNLKQKRYLLNYYNYLEQNFAIQEYIITPSKYNTTVRIITTPSDDLLYASLKYKKPVEFLDDTSLLGYLLNKIYPISTKSIVSNTLSGGKNILIGDINYTYKEERLLKNHNIDSDQFYDLLAASKKVHTEFKSELGIICGFDYIYDVEKDKWFLLEYHSRPMVGDYSKRQGLSYETKEERNTAEGRVRATALSLTLKKM